MNKKGFSLVELLVSVGIASLLMVGLSVFFTTSLKQAFTAEEQATASQEQFTANAILQQKLQGIRATLNNFSGTPLAADHLVALNQPEEPMPFTYIGKKTINGEDKLVMKDWVPFNKIMQNAGGQNLVGGSGAGVIRNLTRSKNELINIPNNFAGFTVLSSGRGSAFLLTLPGEDKIISCAPPRCIPRDLSLTSYRLKTPMDITSNGAANRALLRFYVSDAGNHKVIEVDSGGNVTRQFEDDFNFPTGLAYYEKVSNQFLFVADTLNHQIKRLKLAGPSNVPAMTIVAGGEDAACAGSARTCKLQTPTGLFVGGIPGGPAGEQALYIADSGNNRILRVRDPGRPNSVTLNFATPNDGMAEAIRRIVVKFPEGVNPSAATATIVGNLNTSGTWTASANEIEYRLFTSLAEDTAVTNACDAEPCPRERIRPSANFFRQDDLVRLAGEPGDLSASVDGAELQFDDSFTLDHFEGEEALLATPVNPGTLIALTINGLESANAFSSYPLLTLQTYGLNDQLLFTRYQGLTVGDGVLGTEEDQVEILPASVPLQFPTGISNTVVANTGALSPQILGAITQSLNPYDINSLTSFDYGSDFVLESAADALQFQKPAGRLLKMILRARVGEGTQTHELQTTLPQ